MPAVSFSRSDLTPFATIDADKADAMVADALAMAQLVAPCIIDSDFAYPDAAKAVLRAAVLRWNESGSGALTQEVIGPFQSTIDTRTRRAMFWPSEIEQLQRLCTTSVANRAFEVDLAPATAGEVLQAPENNWPTYDYWPFP